MYLRSPCTVRKSTVTAQEGTCNVNTPIMSYKRSRAHPGRQLLSLGIPGTALRLPLTNLVHPFV